MQISGGVFWSCSFTKPVIGLSKYVVEAAIQNAGHPGRRFLAASPLVSNKPKIRTAMLRRLQSYWKEWLRCFFLNKSSVLVAILDGASVKPNNKCCSHLAVFISCNKLRDIGYKFNGYLCVTSVRVPVSFTVDRAGDSRTNQACINRE